eukprot:jgi/Ulvmu1/1077/UM105_0036.1
MHVQEEIHRFPVIPHTTLPTANPATPVFEFECAAPEDLRTWRFASAAELATSHRPPSITDGLALYPPTQALCPPAECLPPAAGDSHCPTAVSHDTCALPLEGPADDDKTSAKRPRECLPQLSCYAKLDELPEKKDDAKLLPGDACMHVMHSTQHGPAEIVRGGYAAAQLPPLCGEASMHSARSESDCALPARALPQAVKVKMEPELCGALLGGGGCVGMQEDTLGVQREPCGCTAIDAQLAGGPPALLRQNSSVGETTATCCCVLPAADFEGGSAMPASAGCADVHGGRPPPPPGPQDTPAVCADAPATAAVQGRECAGGQPSGGALACGAMHAPSADPARAAQHALAAAKRKGGHMRELSMLLTEAADTRPTRRRRAARGGHKAPTTPAVCSWDAYRSREELPTAAQLPEDAEHLVIDGQHVGSVSRFFNHSCEPTVACQNVLLPGAGGAMLYAVAFFADGDIPAMAELRWNYYAEVAGEVGEGSVPCLCGGQPCRKWLC